MVIQIEPSGEARNQAAEIRDLYNGLLSVSFTDEQAIRLLCALLQRPTQPPQEGAQA